MITGADVFRATALAGSDKPVACRLDGQFLDLATPIRVGTRISFVFIGETGPDDGDALNLLRHSTAHVMAEAIQQLWPEAQLVYGPATTDGFFYDIRFPEGVQLSTKDFPAIEARMGEIIASRRPFVRYELTTEEGMRKLECDGNKYKVDNARRAVGAGDARLSFYSTGKPGAAWEDLCRGPHVPDTGWIASYKLLSISSSYWHGDENSDRLTRVYGTAFFRQSDLDRYLRMLEEARERDHRVIGKRQKLFVLDEMVGPGLVLWQPAGAIIRLELQTFISAELKKQGYQQVFTPHIGKLELYRTSGHFPYYAESQFPPFIERELLSELAVQGTSCADLSSRLGSGDIQGYLLKPMNCPHHVRIFASCQYSYRDLPVRLSEFGTVYRWEQSGELNGLLRVRGFTQDDAHLFCTEEQVAAELQGCLSLVKTIFATLGMTEYRVRLGLRDPDSPKYIGSAENWAKAEQACKNAALSLGVPFSEEQGEAAFYGPKIDFVVKDVLGREWQLGTVQVDYNLPNRFGLEYIGADGQMHRPVMIHRAPFGAMERFCGVLIEHFAGAFPTWLAPEQVCVIPVSEKSSAYARRVARLLMDGGVRAGVDDRNDRIQGKIRVAAEAKVPYTLVVGPRDEAANSVSVRVLGVEKDLGAMPLDRYVELIKDEIASRALTRKVAEQFAQ